MCEHHSLVSAYQCMHAMYLHMLYVYACHAVMYLEMCVAMCRLRAGNEQASWLLPDMCA